MSYAVVRRRASGGPARIAGLGVVYPQIPTGYPFVCEGGLYHYNRPYDEIPDAEKTEANCCPLSTWSEVVLRDARPDLWAAYLEDIVRRNVYTWISPEGIDNAAYDIPMKYQQAPYTLDYSAKLTQAATRALGNFGKLFQPRAMTVVKNGGKATFCKSSGNFDLWVDPGNPDKASEAQALKDIFGRTPSAKETAEFFARARAVFEESPRWYTARIQVPLPPEWGDGSWSAQPPAVNVGDYWWWNSSTETLQPKPWTRSFLDTFAPGWSKASISTSLAKPTTKSTLSISRQSPRLSSTIIARTAPAVQQDATQDVANASSSQMSTYVKVAIIASAGVAVVSLGYLGYVLVSR